MRLSRLNKTITESHGQRETTITFTQPDVLLQIGNEQYLATISYTCDVEYGLEPGERQTYDHPGSPGGVVDIYPIDGTIDIEEIEELSGPGGEPMNPPTVADPEAWRMVHNAATRAFNPDWPNFIEAATEAASNNHVDDNYADEMYDRWKDSRYE